MILAGGLGTRMGGVLAGRPKALAEIAGRPFIEHLIRFLARQGQRDVIVCTGVGADAIADRLGDGSRLGVSLAYSREDEPLGTAGAIRQAAALVDGSRWLVLNGDSLVDVSLSELAARHVERRARATLTLARVANATAYGAVRLAPADDAIQEFNEKPTDSRGGFINAGICLLERDVLELIPERGAASLERDVFPRLVGAGLYGLPTAGAFVDIGTAAAYQHVRDSPDALVALAG